jgi:hypothetical protein
VYKLNCSPWVYRIATYDLISQHKNIMLRTDLGNGSQLFPSEDLSGRVVRSVENDYFGLLSECGTVIDT